MLAKYLGMDFVDTDLLIQKREGKKLAEIIEEAGPQAFIEIENDVIKHVNAENTIIATGGSAVFGQEAMEHLKGQGPVIYLKISYGEMKKRLKNKFRKRGVVMREGTTLRDLYEERCPLYEKYADFVIDEGTADSEENLQTILNVLSK